MGEKMKIAVCDNEQVILDEISREIEEYVSTQAFDLTYETFTSYENLIERIDEFDLFVLDHNMDDSLIDPNESQLMTGVEFAKIVRNTADTRKGIIILTSYHDIVYDTFDIGLVWFLRKPASREELFKAFDNYFHSVANSGSVAVKINNEIHFISTDKINYIEVFHKDVFVHTDDETLRCHKSIADFEKELAPFGFFRTHRSYIVNISKIKSINNKKTVMKNGDTVYTSEKNFAKLRELYLENRI